MCLSSKDLAHAIDAKHIRHHIQVVSSSPNRWQNERRKPQKSEKKAEYGSARTHPRSARLRRRSPIPVEVFYSCPEYGAGVGYPALFEPIGALARPGRRCGAAQRDDGQSIWLREPCLWRTWGDVVALHHVVGSVSAANAVALTTPP